MTTQVKEGGSVIINRPALQVSEPSHTNRAGLSRTALIDSEGTVVAIDNGWMDFARRIGAPLDRVKPGVNYLQLCLHSSSVVSHRIRSGIEAVLRKEMASFAMDYACNTSTGHCCIRMNATRFTYQNASVAITHTDITDLHSSDPQRVQVEQRLADLQEQERKRRVHRAGLLVEAQEQERRRISQEIHDDLGNRIALIVFSIRKTIKEARKPSEAGHEFRQILADVMDLSCALRDISHSLYPPSIRYGGIDGALKTLAQHFEQTHRISVQTLLPKELPRLSDEVQLGIFRISQECLNNIAKHSGADKARILLQHTRELVRLAISDLGRGFDPSAVAFKGGLGLLSMEERALSMGGHLMVSSSPGRGTKVTLTVPIEENDVPHK